MSAAAARPSAGHHLRRIVAIVRSRLIEVLRDRMILVWNLLIAPLLLVGIAISLSDSTPHAFEIGVVDGAAPTPAAAGFLATEGIDFKRFSDRQQGFRNLQQQHIDLLIDSSLQPLAYWSNPESAKSRLAETLLRNRIPDAVGNAVSGQGVRHADWLVPGLIGINIMFTSLLAVGHVIVRYRKSGYLKRLNGTPLRAGEFIAAHLSATLLIVVGVAVFVFTACSLLLHLRIEGSPLLLLLATMLGSMAMTALGLLACARVTSEELSNLLLNLLAWPMLVLPGAFVPLDGAPAFMRVLAQFSPLTHLLDASRKVMLEGAGLAEIATPLLVLAAMTATFLLLGIRLFKWSQD